MSHRSAAVLKFLLVPLFLLAAVGCSGSYSLPGKGVDLQSIGLAVPRKDQPQTKKSTIKFPANLMLVRIQGPHYEERTVKVAGSGSYVVVLNYDVESQDTRDQLAHLPLVATGGLITPRKLDLPSSLESAKDLCTAAAAQDADVMLVYTFDDSFEQTSSNDTVASLTFGLVATYGFTLTSTASAVLVDVRSGLVYGAVEDIEQKRASASAGGYTAAGEAARKEMEGKAFDEMAIKTKRLWAQVCKRYAPPGSTTNP